MRNSGRILFITMLLLINAMIPLITMTPSQKLNEKTPRPHFLLQKEPLETLIDDSYQILLSEGFEADHFPPDQWSETRTNQQYHWIQDSMNKHTGDFSACCPFDPDNNQQNEWLITPFIDLAGYTECFLVFSWFMSYFWSVNPYDHYDFIISISSEDDDEWIPIWDEEEVGLFENWIWLNTSSGQSIDLSSFCRQQRVQIAFQYNGSDGAQLNIDDICVYGRKISNPLTLNAGGPYLGYVGEPVPFYPSVSGGEPPFKWRWEFGDGSLSTERTPVHQYQHIGNYSVRLQVQDAIAVIKTDTTFVRICNMSKTPELVITNVSGPIGVEAVIENRCGMDAYNVSWRIYLNNWYFTKMSNGSLFCLKKRCQQVITSDEFTGFGLIDINIEVTAENMNRIAKQCQAFMLGKYVFPLPLFNR